jgi:hypothetical protein
MECRSCGIDGAIYFSQQSKVMNAAKQPLRAKIGLKATSISGVALLK